MTLFRTLFVLALTLAASTASAQTIGTFRWRTAPYCNVMNVTVTQVGSVYRLEGFEEQCGGNPRQPIWGIGVLQPNGSITLGFSVVPVPGPANPVTIRASLGSDFNGAWADNDTNSGTLEFNPPNCASGCGGPRTNPGQLRPPRRCRHGGHGHGPARRTRASEAGGGGAVRPQGRLTPATSAPAVVPDEDTRRRASACVRRSAPCAA